ncbi:MAG: transposase [Acidobacteria bacterium]|nr:transposase [Acidobacteriota bacterium]
MQPTSPIPPAGYQPRRPHDLPLHRLLSAHWPEFLARARQAGGLPSFVVRELERLLECGDLEAGFTRVWCPTCKDALLVPLSCKGRGVCSSCSGRRMSDTAARWVDTLLPATPWRQLVLTFPWPLRRSIAYDPRLRSELLRHFLRAATRWYAARAGVPDGRLAAVTVIQRFGDALNLNPHFHTLVADGVFHRPSPQSEVRFHAAPPPTDAEVAQLLEVVSAGSVRILKRLGYLEEEDDCDDPDCADPDDSDPDPVAALAEGSVLNLGVDGSRPRRLSLLPQGSSQPIVRRATPLCVHADGFSLHAATRVPRNQRGRLEALCRYILRPAVPQDRLELTADGHARWALKRRWSDGTTHIELTPRDFIARLVPLIPAPRRNQVRYHGVLAPNAAWRDEVIELVPPPPPNRHPAPLAPAVPELVPPPDSSAQPPLPTPFEPASSSEPPAPSAPVAAPPPQAPACTTPRLGRYRYLDWAGLLARTFLVDVLRCGRCGGRRKVLEFEDRRRSPRRGTGTGARPPPRRVEPGDSYLEPAEPSL